MICPHCSTAVKYPWQTTGSFNEDDNDINGSEILYAVCPNCQNEVVYLQKGELEARSYGGGHYVSQPQWKKMIYPKESNFQNPDDIPKNYWEDYEEALKVLSGSPKASAALSRRVLQSILRDEYKVTDKTLSREIEKFIALEGIPSHITDAVDAVRLIGNLAAHPTKDTKTGEIVPVETGEAEWLIEVIEALFDFTFIQPIKLQRRKQELNEKLEKIGKPKMK